MTSTGTALAVAALLVAIVNACVLIRMELDMRSMERDLRRWRRELEMVLPCRHKGERSAIDGHGRQMCLDCYSYIAEWRVRDGD